MMAIKFNKINNKIKKINILRIQWRPTLQGLRLEDNQVADLAPLVAHTGLREGDEVHLTGNPLSDQALNEQIPALQARGVHIKYQPTTGPRPCSL